MPERQRVPGATLGQHNAQRVVSAFVNTEARERLYQPLRRVVKVRNARSAARSRWTARAGGYERLPPLPLKRDPALGDTGQTEPALAPGQRGFAAQIHRGAP